MTPDISASESQQPTDKSSEFISLTAHEIEALQNQYRDHLLEIATLENQERSYHQTDLLEAPIKDGYISRSRNECDFWKEPGASEAWYRKNKVAAHLIEAAEKSGTSLSRRDRKVLENRATRYQMVSDTKERVTFSTREQVLIDRQKDTFLRALIADWKTDLNKYERDEKLNEFEKARELLAFMHKKVPNHKEKNLEIRPYLLGEILQSGKASCRHLALLLSILGEEAGLRIDIRRGNALIIEDQDGRAVPSDREGHAWGELILGESISAFQKGQRILLDPNYNPQKAFAVKYLDRENRPLQHVDPRQNPIPFVEYL